MWYNNTDDQLQNDSIINLDTLPNDHPFLRQIEIEEAKRITPNKRQQSTWPRYNTVTVFQLKYLPKILLKHLNCSLMP